MTVPGRGLPRPGTFVPTGAGPDQPMFDSDELSIAASFHDWPEITGQLLLPTNTASRGRLIFERGAGIMDFELTDEQQLIREAVREFAGAEVAPIAAEVDRDHRFPRAAAEAG